MFSMHSPLAMSVRWISMPLLLLRQKSWKLEWSNLQQAYGRVKWHHLKEAHVMCHPSEALPSMYKSLQIQPITPKPNLIDSRPQPEVMPSGPELSYNGPSNWAFSGGALAEKRLPNMQDLEVGQDQQLLTKSRYLQPQKTVNRGTGGHPPMPKSPSFPENNTFELKKERLGEEEPHLPPSTLGQLHKEAKVRLADVGADVLAMYLPTPLSTRGVVGELSSEARAGRWLIRGQRVASGTSRLTFLIGAKG
ncbi:hypothetical protein FNV43_RR21640 [Rhamnella rubrinervis]|uniref:Uncharacterized protein n=1 Tax=Rhamnella rubrinervis TaxID=2594499 RepID=A0A8K0DNZ2_9ROSA|nr:hypothetical protein FNV43_RR21640 [Rhamnella rubrinervis]